MCIPQIQHPSAVSVVEIYRVQLDGFILSYREAYEEIILKINETSYDIFYLQHVQWCFYSVACSPIHLEIHPLIVFIDILQGVVHVEVSKD